MRVYKILHKPTGLFYKPSKHRSKSNLSERGKAYQTKPSLTWVVPQYNHPTTFGREGYERRTSQLTDWEIIEYEIG